VRSSSALVHPTDPGCVGPKFKPLCDEWLAADGIRASNCQHLVQHRYADGTNWLIERHRFTAPIAFRQMQLQPLAKAA
jgi:hypothetical protein